MTGATAPLAGQGADAARVLLALEKVVAAGLADSSDRQRSLLRYLVTEEIEGRGDRIKAFTVATDVFGRGADFDAQQDAIVRVEMGRLRKSLELYYATAGRNDPVRFAIDKGQYRPSFEMREPYARPRSRFGGRVVRRVAAAATVALAVCACVALWLFWPDRRPELRSGPRIAVAPFAVAADRDGQAYLGSGLRAELVSILSEFDWLTVFPIARSIDLAAGERPAKWAADFLVKANVQLAGDTVIVQPLLLDGRTGAVRWSGRYETPFKADGVVAMQRDIASRVAADVGQPYGAVIDIERTRAPVDQFRGDEAFRCHLRALQFWTTYRRADFDVAHECAQRVGGPTAADPNIRAVLAMLKLDAARFDFLPKPRIELLSDAAEIAADAYQRNEKGATPRMARYSLAACLGDVDGFRRIAQAVARDYPNNPATLADVGSKLALSAGDWTEGLDLLARARALSSNMPIWVDIAAAVDSLRSKTEFNADEYHVAAMEASHPPLLLVDLALQNKRKNDGFSRATTARLAEIGYDGADVAAQLLDRQCWTQGVKDLLRPLLR